MQAMQDLFSKKICLIYLQTDQSEFITKETSAYYLDRLCKHLQIDDDIKYSPTGKPYFEDESLHFNISNSGNIWCAAVHIYPLGIDVEITTNNHLISSLDPILGIETLEDWCSKEAILKCLDLPLDEMNQIKKTSVIDIHAYLNKKLKVIPISNSVDYICMLATTYLDCTYKVIYNEL